MKKKAIKLKWMIATKFTGEFWPKAWKNRGSMAGKGVLQHQPSLSSGISQKAKMIGFYSWNPNDLYF